MFLQANLHVNLRKIVLVKFEKSVLKTKLCIFVCMRQSEAESDLKLLKTLGLLLFNLRLLETAQAHCAVWFALDLN